MELSILSSFEMANLIGSYYKLSKKDSVDPRLLERGYTPEQIAILMKQPITQKTNIISCGLKITGDLDQFKEPGLNFYLSAFHAYDTSGILPFPGTFSEQPAKILDIFDIMSQLKFDEEDRIRKETERELKRKK